MSIEAIPQDRAAFRTFALKRRLPQVFGMLLIYGACLLLPGGLDFTEGWVALGLYFAAMLTGGLFVAWRNPEVVLERSRMGKNTRGWDKVWAVAYGVTSLGVFVVAGLDHRFGWSALPWWAKAIGAVGLLVSMALTFWAMDSNRFLATTVRIQDERGHQVATGGPYAFVRHPMYAGMLVSLATSPALLDSTVAWIPAGVSMVLVVIRTALEDAMLRQELAGYADYAQRTRFRLLPGVW
ncbi:MAG: methyltransferase family protein [Myxococcota bacterium]